jgi:hypothetical protein
MLAELLQYTDCWQNKLSLNQVERLLTANCWTYLDVGRQRAAYRRDGYVFKVPINLDGVFSNQRERRMWATFRQTDEVPYAACRLVCGIFLIMEYALFPGPHADNIGYVSRATAPSWASYVDNGQIGYTRRGKLVAWDFGMD